MEDYVFSHSSATNYIHSKLQQEFEACLCSSSDVLVEIGALCLYLSKKLAQVLNNISEEELYNDNHLTHTDVFVSEVKQGISSLDLTCAKSLLQSTYCEDYKEEYFSNALMKVLDELELCHEYTFINNSPIWIDQFSEFCQKETAVLCKGGIWNTTKTLKFVSYKMPYAFQREYSVSDNLLEQASAEFEIAPKNILNGSHMLHDMANVESIFEEYNPSAISTKQIEKYVELAGYVEFPHHLHLLVQQCRCHDRWDLWISIWDKLQHPVLQDFLLWSCKPLIIFDDRLRNALLKVKHVAPAMKLYFHHWIKSWQEYFENLYTYEQEYTWQAKRIKNDGIDAKAKAEREVLQDSFSERCDSLFAFLTKILSSQDVVGMVSEIRSLDDAPDSVTKKAWEFIRITLTDQICSRYASQKFKVEGLPFGQLIILSRMATESVLSSDYDYLNSLWNAVESCVQAEKFYWGEKLTNQNQYSMLYVARLFLATHVSQQSPMNDYIKDHQVKYEGWGVKGISQRSDLCRSECYMLCVFLMSLIDDNDMTLEFREKQLLSIVRYAISQDKSSHDTVSCSAYQRVVLVLAKCITSQKLTSSNEKLDQFLIETIDNFIDLAEIFINSSSVLSTKNKAIFKSRYDVEWPVEKQFLQSHPHRRNFSAIEKWLNQLIN